MKQEFMNSKDDLDWAKEVHRLPKEAKSFILYGNEDAPNCIEWWKTKDPSYRDSHSTLVLH